MSVINTNILSMNAQRQLASSRDSMATSVQRLSSGLRVNSAKDDAAGLAISERFTSQIRGNQVAIRNANDAISMFQTAEGAVGSMTNNLQRVRELAVQAANPTLSATDRTNLDVEVQALLDETERIRTGTTVNDIDILGGGLSEDFVISYDGTTVAGPATDLSAALTSTGDVTSAANATTLLGTVDADLDTLNSFRAELGAQQSRFGSIAAQLATTVENVTAARSRIMDADFAVETANLSRSQILQQAGMAMVAQANQLPQGVLALLR